MQEKDKKYILENASKRSVKEISEKLGLKERKVRRFLETEEARKRTGVLPKNHGDTYDLWI
jgi:DNA-binding Lrp family transcriptional regulator